MLHHADRLVLKLAGGRATLTAALTGLPVVILTTWGARSGKQHTTPLLAIRDDESPHRFAVIASNFGQRHFPAWYYNLKAHVRAWCTIGGRTAEYIAREAHGEEYEKFWRLASDLYPGYLRYRERAGRRIPIMVLAMTAPE